MYTWESMADRAGATGLATSHLEQLLFKLLRVVRQIRDPVHHLLNCRRVGVVQSRRLGRGHYCLQQVAQHIARVHHPVGHLRDRRLPRQRVSDEDQFVGAQYDKLAVCHKDSRRLAGADAVEEGVHGAEQRGEVLPTLLGVEAEQLPVPAAHVGRRGEGGG